MPEIPKEAAMQMFDALLFVRQWMDGMPTPSGWRYPHGSKEAREKIEAAIRAADQK